MNDLIAALEGKPTGKTFRIRVNYLKNRMMTFLYHLPNLPDCCLGMVEELACL